MPMEQHRDVFFEKNDQSKALKANLWVYRRARISGDSACYSLDFLKRTMDLYISDSRHPTILNEMRASFQQGIASELSLDASALLRQTARKERHLKEERHPKEEATNPQKRVKEKTKIHVYRAGITIVKCTRKQNRARSVTITDFSMQSYHALNSARCLYLHPQ